MTILTHILVTALVAKAMNLSGNDLVWAYAFGVLPDLDHLVKIPAYIKKNKFGIERHFPWRTFLQEPIMLIPVFVYSLFIHNWVPFIFFTMHILMDYLISYEKHPFSPLHNFKTKGFLQNIDDLYKESIMIASVMIGFMLI